MFIVFNYKGKLLHTYLTHAVILKSEAAIRAMAGVSGQQGVCLVARIWKRFRAS